MYPGWLSHWGDASFANTSALGAAGDVNAFLYNNGSFNLCVLLRTTGRQ